MESTPERVVRSPTVSPILPEPVRRRSRSTSRVQPGGNARRRSRSRSSRHSRGRLSRCSPNQHAGHRDTSRRASQRTSSHSSGRDSQLASNHDEQHASNHDEQRASLRISNHGEYRASNNDEQRPSQRVSNHGEHPTSNQDDQRASQRASCHDEQRTSQRDSDHDAQHASQHASYHDEQRTMHRARSRSNQHIDQRRSSRSSVHGDHRASSSFSQRISHRTSQHANRRNTRCGSRSVSNERSRSPLQHRCGGQCSSQTSLHLNNSSRTSGIGSQKTDQYEADNKSVAQPQSSNQCLTDLVTILKSMSDNSLGKLGSMKNTVPEFDPSKKEQTMTMWIHKVNECATIYGWTEKQTIHFALPKLKGVAQRWYEGLPSVLFTWVEWQEKLLAAFPSEENYGQMLSDMLVKRARFTDSLEEYYYEKLALVNRCSISGRRAVECILHGIDDRSVRLGAEAAQFDDPNKLLSFLRNARNIKPNPDRRPARGLPSRQQTNPTSVGSKTPRCSNCKKDGHFTSQCTQTVKKCTRCGRVGHETEQCFAKIQTNEKAVMRVGFEDELSSTSSILADSLKTSFTGSEPNQKYYKTASVNGYSTFAYIDFGSECSMMRVSEFKNVATNYSVDNLPTLRGFGNSIVTCIGKHRVQVSVDGVEAAIDLLIVPDDAMHVPLLIGQTFTEQPHVVVQKTSSSLEISQLGDLDIARSSKVCVVCSSSIEVVGITVVEVHIDASSGGEVYVEGGVRFLKGVRYYVLSGLYHFGDDGEGHIVVNNPSSTPFVLPKDLLVARGRIAEEESLARVMTVTGHISDDKHEDALTETDVRIGNGLTFEQKTTLLNLLNKHRKSFAFTLSELGSTTVGNMSIELYDNEPVVYRPYRLAFTEKEKVRGMISELLENDIIRPSTSPYASPIVVVRKKTGDLRLCIDFRALNKKTIKENYPMPLIDDQLDVLSGNNFYTTLDLASGYYQIPINEVDKHKTGFVTPDGHYEFNRMPFGLANAPATFQRIMNQVLGSLRHKEALAYLDDIIIPSTSFDEGIKRLETVLILFSQAGLTLKLSKCVFFGSCVEYLGFEVSSEGIRPGSRKIEAVERFPVPQNQHNVRQFIGLASFFRRFVPQFSVIAKPLTQLLKKDCKWIWTTDQENSFCQLKNLLSQRPTLALYNPQAYTELHTDACKIGVAGILLQKDGHEVLKPVAYFSRQTTPEEQNYTSYDLETLAVVASLQKFRVYLIGVPFKVITDCNSLRATFQKRDMIPRVARWWEQMQEYNFSIEYRAGQRMAHVDALSRNPIPDTHMVLSVTDSDWLSTVQSADDEIQKVIGILKDPDMDNVVDIKTNFKLKNNKLFRITTDGDRWVVPKGVRWQILKQNHDDIGHFALDKTLERIKATFWFSKMRKFAKKYINSCLECAYAKSAGGKKPGMLHPIEKIDNPFDTIHADHVGPFVRSTRGNMYVLVLIDGFTRYIFLKPVKNTKSQTTIRVFKEYFGIFGVPRRVITDRGTSFTSESFKNFVAERNIKHVLNAVSTPRANGQVERYNRTLIESLTAKCVGSAENKWDEHLPDVQWGLNNTFNRGINCTPSEALFGTRPYGTSDSRIRAELAEDVTNSSNQGLSELREQINDHVKAYQEAQKKAYDEKRLQSPKYNVGDLVRVERQITATGSSRKLIPKYQGPYRITKVYDLDRYHIEDTPLTKKGNKLYSTIVAVDKIKPWLNFKRPHDSSSDGE